MWTPKSRSGALTFLKHQVVKLRSATLFDSGSEISSDDVWICDGKIVDAKARFWQAQQGKEFAADIEVDCTGLCICPGFIDWQLNGAIGVDFSSGDNGRSLTEGVSAVAAHVAKHGVTLFCPTVITSSRDVYKTCIPHFKPTPGGRAGAGAIGLHLEGPCLNAKRNGAHDRALLQQPSSFTEVYGCPSTHVKVVTLAPELDPMFSFTKQLISLGIVVSIGHSNASLPEAQQAIAAGATAVTHMFNAMSGFHHRDNDSGVVGLLGEPDCGVAFGLIVDGIHAQRNACRVARQCAPGRISLVTDAMSATGLGPGHHKLSNVEVTVTDDRATVVGTDTLAGSIIEMDACVANYAEFTGCSLAEAIDAATIVNARLLGIDQAKGSLAPGKDADLVVFKREMNSSGKERCVLKCHQPAAATQQLHHSLPPPPPPLRLAIVCTIAAGEVAYQQPQHEWLVRYCRCIALASCLAARCARHLLEFPFDIRVARVPLC